MKMRTNNNKITRYMGTQEQQQQNPTTTNPRGEHQNNNATNIEQQQQAESKPPILTIRTKGIVITDMKEFFARKKMERAAWMGNMFHGSFVLQFCCCMVLIAATRAEGGLVSWVPNGLVGFDKKYFPRIFSMGGGQNLIRQ